MILIDVLVPPLDKIYDFEVDENVSAKSLKDNVQKLIEYKEKVMFSLEERALFLYRVGDFLNENTSLVKQGLIDGDRIILV